MFLEIGWMHSEEENAECKYCSSVFLLCNYVTKYSFTFAYKLQTWIFTFFSFLLLPSVSTKLCVRDRIPIDPSLIWGRVMASIFSDGNLNSFYNKTREKWDRTRVSSYHSFPNIALHTEKRERWNTFIFSRYQHY